MIIIKIASEPLLNANMIYGSGLLAGGAVPPNGSTVPPYTQVNQGVSRRKTVRGARHLD